MGELAFRMRKPYLRNPNNHHLLQNFKGEIYECFAYFEILRITQQEVKIITKLKGKSKCRNFVSDKYGQIIYKSDNVFLGEFDVLGFDDDTIYYWEICMSNQNHRDKLKRLSSKEELLAKIFPSKRIKVIIVSPAFFEVYGKYENIMIPLPNFDTLIQSESFHYDTPQRELYELAQLVAFSEHYGYIDEIIQMSNSYFLNVNVIPKQHLIERVYDLSSFSKEKICAYDIEKKKYQCIEVKKKTIYKDRKKVKGIKKTFKEVTEIMKRQRGTSK